MARTTCAASPLGPGHIPGPEPDPSARKARATWFPQKPFSRESLYAAALPPPDQGVPLIASAYQPEGMTPARAVQGLTIIGQNFIEHPQRILRITGEIKLHGFRKLRCNGESIVMSITLLEMVKFGGWWDVRSGFVRSVQGSGRSFK